MTVIGNSSYQKLILCRWGKKKVTAIGYAGAGITLYFVIVFLWTPSNLTLMIVLHALYGFFVLVFQSRCP